MKKNTLITIVVLIVLALGAWYYFSSRPAPSPTASEEVSSGSDTSNETNGMQGTMETGEIPNDDSGSGTGASVGVTVGSVKEFTISGSNFAFAPKAISVKKGDHVKITFVNSGGMHDLRLDEFNVGTRQIGSGETASIEFVANKTGSFQYYCSVGNHRAMGMWGTLTITE